MSLEYVSFVYLSFGSYRLSLGCLALEGALVDEHLVAAHLTDDNIVFLPEFVTLTNVAPDEYRKEQYE